MTVEELIEKSLIETAKLVLNGESNFKIITPFYRAKEDDEFTIRYSEQELKQVFLTCIEKFDLPYYYSVETPSEYVYSISNSKTPEIKQLKEKDDHYESARIDVTLYKENNPKKFSSHIEFKHGNPDVKDISKDFLRLTHEIGEYKNFFVQYIVRESNMWMTKTFPSIMEKFCESLSISGINETNFNNVEVFLMFVIRKDNSSVIKLLKFSLQSLYENKNLFVQKHAFDEKELTWMEIKTIGESSL